MSDHLKFGYSAVEELWMGAHIYAKPGGVPIYAKYQEGCMPFLMENLKIAFCIHL